MKYLLTFLLTMICVSPALAQDDMNARLKAARAYEDTTPVIDLMDNMVEEFKKNPQIGDDPAMMDIMFGAMDKQAMKEDTIKLMAKHFTVDELNALTAFYSSPEGKSVMNKMPLYMSESMPIIQREVMKGVGAVQAEIARRQQQKGQSHGHDH